MKENKNLVPQFWTRNQTAIINNISLKTLDRLIRDGRIKSFKIGRKVLIYPDSFTEENINAIKPRFLSPS